MEIQVLNRSARAITLNVPVTIHGNSNIKSYTVQPAGWQSLPKEHAEELLKNDLVKHLENKGMLQFANRGGTSRTERELANREEKLIESNLNTLATAKDHKLKEAKAAPSQVKKTVKKQSRGRPQKAN